MHAFVHAVVLEALEEEEEELEDEVEMVEEVRLQRRAVEARVVINVPS